MPQVNTKNNNNKGKRPGSEKRNKIKDLHIHKTIPIPSKEIPAGAAVIRSPA